MKRKDVNDEEDDDIFFFSSTEPSVTIRAPAYTINVVTPPPPIPITVKSSIHSIIPKPVVSIPVTSLITPITIKSFIPVNVKSTTHSIKPVVSVPVKQISTVINVEEALAVTSSTPVSVTPTSTSTPVTTREVNIVSSLHTIKPVVSVPVKTTSTLIKPVVSLPVKTLSTLIKPVVSVPVKQISTPIDINTPIIVNTSTVDISSVNNSISIKEKQKETKDVSIKNRLHKINVKNSNWGIKGYDNWYHGLLPEKSISFIKDYKQNNFQHHINTGGFYILFVKDDQIWVRHIFNDIQPIPLFETLHNLGYSIEQDQQNQIFYSKKYDNEFITNNIQPPSGVINMRQPSSQWSTVP